MYSTSKYVYLYHYNTLLLYRTDTMVVRSFDWTMISASA